LGAPTLTGWTTYQHLCGLNGMAIPPNFRSVVPQYQLCGLEQGGCKQITNILRQSLANIPSDLQ
jgi:hypothetical protein